MSLANGTGLFDARTAQDVNYTSGNSFTYSALNGQTIYMSVTGNNLTKG